MAKFQQAMIEFGDLRPVNITLIDISQIVRGLGLGFSLTWPSNPNTALGAINSFVYPPVGYENLMPVFVTADNEEQLVTKLLAATPRLLKDLADTEIVLAAGVEYVIPDRAKIKRDALTAAKKAAKAAEAEASKGITDGARKVALKAA